MVVRNMTGKPLPYDHPFKGMQIHFGLRPPTPSTDKPEAWPEQAARPDQSTPHPVPDLQNLPEDPAIRPMLISHGVPRNFWPQGDITAAQAEELIRQYGNKT